MSGPASSGQPVPPSAPPDHASAAGVAELQRRTVRVLALTNALGGIGVTTGIAVATLLMVQVSGTEAFAGLSQTSQVIGAALIAVLLSAVMARRGRRAGLVLGYGMGALGAAVCVLGGALSNTAVLLAGAFCFGSASAANSQSRFAATDLATPQHRAQDLSTVVWATTIGAVVGPNLADAGGWVARPLGLPALTGPFLLTAVALLGTAAVVHLLLRPDPLLIARTLPAHHDGAATDHVSPWRVIAGHPAIAASVAAIAINQAVMVTVMIMTPIHMRHGDASIRLIGATISIHILGMYAFMPLVGRLVDRLRPWRALLVGAAVMLAALTLSATSHAGASWWLGAGLFLLGVGWAVGSVSASTLLVAATPTRHRPQVQGRADLVMGLTAAVGGALGGVVVGSFGYGVLAWGCVPLLAVLVGCAVIARRH